MLPLHQLPFAPLSLSLNLALLLSLSPLASHDVFDDGMTAATALLLSTATRVRSPTHAASPASPAALYPSPALLGSRPRVQVSNHRYCCCRPSVASPSRPSGLSLLCRVTRVTRERREWSVDHFLADDEDDGSSFSRLLRQSLERERERKRLIVRSRELLQERIHFPLCYRGAHVQVHHVLHVCPSVFRLKAVNASRESASGMLSKEAAAPVAPAYPQFRMHSHSPSLSLSLFPLEISMFHTRRHTHFADSTLSSVGLLGGRERERESDDCRTLVSSPLTRN